jgi:hypothetical protein
MNRIIFIHGFGEKPGIFDKIHPAFSHPKLFINNWEELGNLPRENFTALDYATHLTQKYQINQNDIVIGLASEVPHDKSAVLKPSIACLTK